MSRSYHLTASCNRSAGGSAADGISSIANDSSNPQQRAPRSSPRNERDRGGRHPQIRRRDRPGTPEANELRIPPRIWDCSMSAGAGSSLPVLTGSKNDPGDHPPSSPDGSRDPPTHPLPAHPYQAGRSKISSWPSSSFQCSATRWKSCPRITVSEAIFFTLTLARTIRAPCSAA